MLNVNPSAAHHLMASLIWTIYLKHPQNGSYKGISTLLLGSAGLWPAGKTNEDTVWAAEKEQHLPTVPVPVHSMEIFRIAEAELDTS